MKRGSKELLGAVILFLAFFLGLGTINKIFETGYIKDAGLENPIKLSYIALLALLFILFRKHLDQTDLLLIKIEKKLLELGFVKRNETWWRKVGDVELEAVADTSKQRPLKIQCDVDSRFLGLLEDKRRHYFAIEDLRERYSEAAAVAAERLFEEKIAIGKPFRYRGKMALDILQGSEVSEIKIDDADIRAIADFFSALKRAGSH